MAGHSKWANIKHRKAAQDKQRGKIFTKLIREIKVAAKIGGGEVDNNPRLRSAVDKALSANMTRDTIDRAIKRGAGGGETENLEEVLYEGYGIAGVAVMVDCLTDNRNRTVAEVRHVFSKYGGNLGTDGSVAYLFTKRGLISFPAGSDEEKIMETALEAGAEDVVSNEDGSVDVFTAADDFGQIEDAMKTAGLTPENVEVTMLASLQVTLDKEQAEKMLRLFDMLEDLDDVQTVYSNADIPEAVLAEL